MRTPPPCVPAVVEPAAVPLDPLRCHVVRRMTRAEREVAEERLVGVRAAQVRDVADRVVDEVFGEVIARAWLEPDRPVVDHEVRRPVVRLRADEAVVALEALAERPAIAGGCRVQLVRRSEVPLPHRHRRPPRTTQDVGHEAAALGDARVIAGEPHGEVGDAAHRAGVMVAAGQEARARRGAHGGRVERPVAQASCGEPIEVRRLDVGTEAPELREADVVEDHQQDVRSTVGSARRDRPRRLRVEERRPDATREHAAVGIRASHRRRLAIEHEVRDLVRAGVARGQASTSLRRNHHHPIARNARIHGIGSTSPEYMSSGTRFDQKRPSHASR